MSGGPRRYGGEPLGDRPRLAIIGSNRLGNFVVTTPLLRGIRKRWPGATVDFLGSPATAELEAACPWIDWRADVFPLDGSSPDASSLDAPPAPVAARIADAGPYDLAINCNGFDREATTLAGRLGARFVAGASGAPISCGDHPYQRMVLEDDWTTREFLARHGAWLTSNYIGELFCRMAFIETDFFRIEIEGRTPGFPVPDVLIHPSSTRDAKLWPSDRWLAVLDACAGRGLSVGLVGAPAARAEPATDGTLASHAVPEGPQDPGRIERAIATHPAVEDLRGRTSPLELAGAFQAARACLSVDSGPLHVAAAVGCPTVAICATDAAGTGASPRDLWMPRGPHVRVTVSERTCGTCLANRFRNSACLEAEPWCQLGVSTDQVIRLLEDLLPCAPD